MKSSAHTLSRSAVTVLLSLLALVLPALASAEEPRSPRSAYDKHDREDLAAPLSEKGEIRVIVGLRSANRAADRPRGRGNDPLDVAFRREVDDEQTRFLERLRRHQLRNIKRFREHAFVAMTVDAAALNDLLSDPDVTSVAEDRPLYPVLYNTPGITRADDAWAAGYRGAGQVVAVIDSGVDKSHPFLAGKVVAEACFSHPVGTNTSYCPSGTQQSTAPGSGMHCPDSSLTCWHGTHVAGIVAGKYGVLSSTTGGIAPDANLIAIQVFQKGCNASGCYIEAYNSDIALALEHVYSLRNTHNIAAVNMSLGGGDYTSTCDSVSPAMTTIINNLRAVNIATVVATGNAGRTNAISFPACISSTVSVGSTSKQNVVSSFSNSASFMSLLAPGGAVTSSKSGGGYLGANGTSMATPHVAGAWAVLKSAKPGATVQEVLAALQTTGTPITDTRNGIVKPLIQIGSDAGQPGALGMLTGQENVPPSATLTAPASNATFAAPAAIVISAAASDSDGTIAKVEFFNGATLLNTDTAAPYAFSWMNVPAGTYSLTARVTDNHGATATTAAVVVTVAAGGGAAAIPVAAYLLNDAWGSSGVTADSIAGRNGVRTGTVNPVSAPAAAPKPNTCQSASFGGGAFDVNALPVSTAAGAKTSVAFWMYWNGTDAVMPAGWQAQALFFYGGSFGFNSFNGDVYGMPSAGLANGWHHVVAEFTNGNVTANKLYVDGALQTLTQRRGAPYNANAVVGPNLRIGGVYGQTGYRFGGQLDEVRIFNGALTAAEVSAQRSAASACAGQPPSVALTGPANNAVFTAPAGITLTAAASDSDGTIAKVEFYNGASLLNTDTAAPYTFDWTSVPAGTYSLTARATDNSGATTTSAAVVVTVEGTGGGAAPIAAYGLNDSWAGSGVATDTVGGHDGVRTGSVDPVAAPAAAPKPETCQGATFSGGAFNVSGLPVTSAAGAKTSVAFWMYWNGTDAVMPVGWQAQNLFLYGGSFGFNTFNGDVYGMPSAGLANGWHHVVAEFTNGSAASNKLYIDGIQQTLTQRRGAPNNANAVVGGNLRIGGVFGDTRYRFSGHLDEVKIFNGALSAADVAAQFGAVSACAG